MLLTAFAAQAAAPVAAISASPVEGRAPLGVFFDAGGSSPDSQSFLWDFGDGSVSTSKTVTHIYTVAGTYVATLTVTNADNETNSSQVTITVTGTGEGPVTADMNFRWVPTSGLFKVNHNQPNRDTLNLISTFNTVDLPQQLEGLAASFSVNGIFTVNGIMGREGGFESPDNRRPSFFVQLSVAEQLLTIFISKATLGDALAASGTKPPLVQAGIKVPITFILTIGAQTYSVTENFQYTSNASSGRGQFNLKKNVGSVNDGFFVVSRASALENAEGTGHFYEFECFLAPPDAKLLQPPGAGTFTFRFNDADPVVILFDSIKQNGNKLTYDQSDRDLGNIRRVAIDAESRRMTIRTWDIPEQVADGGTGLPGRGRPFTAFNFTLRIDFDQPDGSTLQAVTATRMTRRTKDDAFWQTGRRKKQQ